MRGPGQLPGSVLLYLELIVYCHSFMDGSVALQTRENTIQIISRVRQRKRKTKTLKEIDKPNPEKTNQIEHSCQIQTLSFRYDEKTSNANIMIKQSNHK